jgi:hypothetical protein
MMTIQERAELYAKAFPEFPDSHFRISKRWISATWITGNNYRNPSSYYGSYPPAYLKRLYALYPDPNSILHLFSGSLTKHDTAHPRASVSRLDIDPKCKPDIKCNAEDLSAWIDRSYGLIIADPPYSIQDAKNYGVCLVNKRKVLEQCHCVLNEGGHLVWMDQSIPMYSKKFWNWIGVISIYRSTNHRVRGVFIFEKV